MFRSFSLGAVAALCLLATANARADEKGNPGQLSEKDYHFMTKAAQANENQVKLGELAEQKSTDPEVKQFSQHMVQEHQQADQELSQILAKKGATLPPESSTKEQHEISHLNSLSGTDFDKAYMNMMVKDHKKDVKAFQQASETAKDPDVKSFASKTVPTLEQHLSMAEKTQADLNAEGKAPKAQ